MMAGLEIRLNSGYGYLFYFHEKNIEKFLAVLAEVNHKNFLTVTESSKLRNFLIFFYY